MLLTVTAERVGELGPVELSDALERGEVVYFPTCPLALPAENDLAYLRERLPRQLHTKNVSYHPESDRLRGIKDDDQLRQRTHDVLKSHSERVQSFLRQTLPSLTEGWTVGTSSFRPIQEQGRSLKAHASNELIHVDAGAYGATDGDRILRFFVNVNPGEDRVWSTKGRFPELYARYGEAAGVAGPSQLERGPLDRLRTGALSGLARIGLAEAVLVDSSPYDRLMRRFHNFMKDSTEFQEIDDDYREMTFPPMSAWMVLTDMVSHASVSGQHALVDTFVLRLSACRLPELAPINILRNGRASP